MDRPNYAIIIGHGDLPRALLTAASEIVGDAEGVTVISNLEPSVEEMNRKLDEALAAFADGNVLIFADMFGTSCATAGARLTRDHANVVLICGVNLPMMVRFLAYRRRRNFDELVELMRETGRSEVKQVPD